MSLLKRKSILQMKDEVLNRPDLSCNEVYQKVLAENVETSEATHNIEEIGATIPMFDNVRTILQRHRSSVRPSLPTSRDDIVLSGLWTETKKGETFLQFDDAGTPLHPKPRILGFGSNRDLEILLKASAVFMDGTFSVVPKQLRQLYTLHAYYM